jgi:Zn-dependent protease with chaperone function
VLLIVTLALAGAVAGQLVHNLMLGMSWATGISRCMEESRRLPGSSLDQALWSLRCEAPLQRRLALVSLGGSAAVLLLGLVGLWILPRRLRRAAGPLRAVPAAWQEQADRIAGEMGIKRAPCLVWGGKHLRDTFTLRRGNRPLIILSKRIRLLRDEEAEAVIRHEMGHVAAGDVTLVWLTRGMWWALVPVLLTAPVLHAMQGVRSEETTSWGMISQPLWGEYGLRSLLLAAIAALIAQMIMRSREHEADLTAAHGQPITPWEAMLGEPETERTLLGSARATHPSRRRRLDVLRDPRLYLRPTVVDTIAVGLLTAVLLDAVNRLAGFLLTGTTWTPAPVSALAAGLLLTFGWGTTRWHDTGHQQEGAAASWWLLPTLGVSTAAGLATGLQNTGTSESGTTLGWPLLVAVPLAVVGAAALSSAFARLWNGRLTTGRTALPGRLAEIVVGTLLFSGALWLASDFCVALRFFRESVVLRAALFAGPHSPSSAHKAIALAAIAALAVWSAARSTHRRGPGRLLPASTAAGAALAAAGTRLVSQPQAAASDWAAVWQLDVLTAVCAGAVCAVMLVVLRGSGGISHALYAAPLAATLTTTALWAARFGSWKHPLEAWATVLAESSLSGTGLVLLALAVPAGFLPSWDTERRSVNISVQILTMVTAAVAITALHHSGTMFLVL